MEFLKIPILTEHPPHDGCLKPPGWARIESISEAIPLKKKSFSVSGTFLKLILFTAAFVISFHSPNFVPDLSPREQAIREILQVLDRQPTGLANVTKEELAEVIYEEASRYNHDPKFILAVIFTESEFYNWAVSQKGAKGLMQIMPYVAKSLARDLGIEWSGDRTLFNPFLNIKIGIYYLSQLINDFKDVGTALTAYNYGPTYVKGLLEKKQQIPHDYYRRFISVYKSI